MLQAFTYLKYLSQSPSFGYMATLHRVALDFTLDVMNDTELCKLINIIKGFPAFHYRFEEQWDCSLLCIQHMTKYSNVQTLVLCYSHWKWRFCLIALYYGYAFMVYDISWSNPCLLLHGMVDFTAICMSNRERGYKLQLTLHQFFYTQLIQSIFYMKLVVLQLNIPLVMVDRLVFMETLVDCQAICWKI